MLAQVGLGEQAVRQLKQAGSCALGGGEADGDEGEDDGSEEEEDGSEEDNGEGEQDELKVTEGKEKGIGTRIRRQPETFAAEDSTSDTRRRRAEESPPKKARCGRAKGE